MADALCNPPSSRSFGQLLRVLDGIEQGEVEPYEVAKVVLAAVPESTSLTALVTDRAEWTVPRLLNLPPRWG